MGEVPEEWKNKTPVSKEKNLGNYRPVILTLILGKATEQIFPETISKHTKDKKVNGSSHHGFMKGKSCLSNLTALCDEMTGLANERRAVYIVYLEFT